MPPFDPEVQANALCAVVAGPERLFGFAVFDSELRAFRICEYTEDIHLSRTEALLLQLQPRTCCQLLQAPEDPRKLGRVAESCGVELADGKAAELKQADVEQDLLRLLVDTEQVGLGRHFEEQRQKQGMRALALLIGQHHLLSEPANFSSCTLGIYPLRTFMYLDKAAFSALNVLPRPEESLRSSTSLLGFLNRCRSQGGQRRLRQWLTQPLTVPEEISQRHDVVEALVAAEGLLRELEGHLRHVPDLERLAARLHRTATASKFHKATLEDLVVLYQCVLSTEKMIQALQTYEGIHQQVIAQKVSSLRTIMGDFRNFKALIEQTVDLRQAEQRIYCISTGFDASLAELANQRDAVRSRMEVVRQEVDKKLGLAGAGNAKAVSLCDCPEGLALRVTKKHQQAIQNFKGIPTLKILSIKKQELVFTTPELDKLNKQLQHALGEYQKKTDQLVNKALAVATTYSSVVERLADELSSLDVLAAFARVAVTAPCTFVRAKIDPDCKNFTVEGASHVLVIANSEKSFVANDLNMERETSRLHLITGPNMGGKSTYIRSIALIALLNQIGSFVPCRSAVLPCFDSVMCRVGASDMQLRGISTFMAEMLEASCILNTATERSLVIVDELGRGTSTSDGFGIAWAIARHLVEETRCFCLFATHFHELAALQHAAPGVRNRHATAVVDAASGKLTFLYSLVDGATDQSYGAHVAELAGFPRHVVESAKKRAEEFEEGSFFGRSAKRQRVENGLLSDDALQYIMGTKDEEEFVRRSMAQLPALQLQATRAAGGGC
ncbi:unnamed protein product [Polarella glacialis]|uniref:DNA mismatch repair proteins mutS family domain-containing protein n=1 Tax=Polarella glacialis TaxID=89957 RepID=A0A813E6N5_POLGL|nr:unnamed protein product [Polarella glacialis]